jgi:hypothetical protein
MSVARVLCSGFVSLGVSAAAIGASASAFVERSLSAGASTKVASAACMRVLEAAKAVFDADHRYQQATTAKQEDAAYDALRHGIAALKSALPNCSPASVPARCTAVVKTARRIVAADDQYSRARTREQAEAAFADQDEAIGELAPRLTDCRSGRVPEPCGAAVTAAGKLVASHERFVAAETEQDEDVALADEDRAIVELTVRIRDCRAGSTPSSCPAVLDAGQRVVDADRQASLAPSLEAIRARRAAISELGAALSSC